MERPWYGETGRRFGRRRRQLAARAIARAGAVEGADAVYAAVALGRTARAAAIPGDRRDRLRAADDRAAARTPRREFGLSQQLDPDLADKTRRQRVRCAAFLSAPSP